MVYVSCDYMLPKKENDSKNENNYNNESIKTLSPFCHLQGRDDKIDGKDWKNERKKNFTIITHQATKHTYIECQTKKNRYDHTNTKKQTAINSRVFF